MKAITGKKLYVLAFVCQISALVIAGYVAAINASWYHVPMFIASFCFAALYYKADMPNMWSYLLLHLAAFAVYMVASALINTGTIVLTGVSAADAVMAIALLAFLSATGVMPVCIAYWVYKLTKRRQRK